MSEMAAGFAYCTALAGALAMAAHWGESALRGVGRPGRWAWFGAMMLSLGVPLAAWLGLRAWTTPLPALPAMVPFALPEVSGAADPAGGGVEWGAWLRLAWAIGSLLILGKLVLGIGRLRAAARGWRAERLSGIDVLVTENVGPAVFGLRHASILMPEWALSIREDLRELMLLHEREHMHARDPWLLAGALAMVVLMPWNAAVWFQLHRLRLAVEMDCDARVLRRVPDRQGYGRLLLEVGRRRPAPLGVLALTEPVSFLERRIRAFTRRAGPHAGRRALALGAGAFCLGSLAVCARDPLSPRPDMVESTRTATDAMPIFTPYSVKPSLRNPAQVAGALRLMYPPLLRDAGIGGTTLMWFYIDERGTVTRTQVLKSSGYGALDAAAMRVASLMQFSPALNRDQAVPVWVQIPITFAAADEAAEATVDGQGGDPQDGRRYSRDRLAVTPTGDGPHFTPYTTKPALINPADVSRMLRREYPPLLRDEGLGGTATLWFHIGADGSVADVRTERSSGYPDLDDAAHRVARRMRFEPALNRGERVAVWVQIPVTFASR